LIGTNILGLTFAFLFSTRKLRGAGAFRNILFSPQIIPIITVGYISSLIFNPSLGTYDKIAGFLHFPDLFVNVLGKPNTALYTISIIEILRLLGFPLTIYYVAINDIPTDIIAASRIDGANDFRILLHIVLAMISPILITTNVLMFIGSFIYFDLIYIMQGYLGGPAFSTDVLGVFFYRTTFGGHHGGGDPGIGAVISMCMLLILAIVAIVGMLMQRTLRRRLSL
jgi:raffinose/stachyose/melibiose transport system permease protein